MNGAPSLTEREQVVVDAIRRFIKQHDLAPTTRQIIAETKIPRNGAYATLRSLIAKKVVQRNGRGGEIALADEYLPEPGLPVVSHIATDLPVPVGENVTGYLPVRELFAGRSHAFLLAMQGDSMVDRHLLAGDLVVVDPDAEVRQDDIAAVVADDETLVRIVTWDGPNLILLSANERKEFRPREYGPDDAVRIIGKVVGALREF